MRGLERKAVHHGCEHSHGIAGRARDAAGRYLDAPEDISAADHNRDFGAQLAGRDQIAGDAVDSRLVDAEGLRTRRDIRPDSLTTTRR